jgi:FtsZ-interacting cell division protein ZipA
MAAWIWVLIVIGVLVVLGVVIFGVRNNREKAQRREEAQELRQKADTHTQQAIERERVAQEQVQQAKESRKVAAEVGARADQIDPDSETPAEDAEQR